MCRGTTEFLSVRTFLAEIHISKTLVPESKSVEKRATTRCTSRFFLQSWHWIRTPGPYPHDLYLLSKDAAYFSSRPPSITISAFQRQAGARESTTPFRHVHLRAGNEDVWCRPMQVTMLWMLSPVQGLVTPVALSSMSRYEALRWFASRLAWLVHVM